MKSFGKRNWVYVILLLLLTAAFILTTFLSPNLILIGILALILIASSAIFFGIKGSLPALITSSACLIYYYKALNDFSLGLLILILANYFVIALVLGITSDVFKKQKKLLLKNINETKRSLAAFSEQKSFYENILSNIPSFIYVKDLELKFIMVNTAYENFVQKNSDFIIGKTDFDLFPEEIARKMAELDKEVIAGNKPRFGIEEYIPLPDGKYAWTIANKLPFYDEQGTLRGLIGITFDISEQKEMSLQLETMLDSLPYEAWLKDLDGRFLFVNKLLAKSLNKNKKDILGKTAMEFFPEEFAKEFIESDQKIINTKKPEYFQQLSGTRENPVLHEVYKTPIINDAGVVIGTTGYSRDISKMQKELNELTRLNNLFSAIIDNIPIMLFIKDAKFLRFTLVNKAAESLMGMKKDEIIGKNDYDLFPKDQADFFVKMDRKALKANNQLLVEEENLTSSKKTVVVRTKKLPLLDKNGQPICIIGISEDITERKEMEKTIKEMAYHDSITGLPNRHLFKDRFELALEYSKRNKKKMMLSMIDFDNFKQINDKFGHDIGDLVLKNYAGRVKRIVRKTDTFARFGGDEFIFIINGFNNIEDIKKFANKIIGAFEEPFFLCDQALYLKGSMGISIYPDDATDQNTLLKYADTAMYSVKKRGGNTFELYGAL